MAVQKETKTTESVERSGSTALKPTLGFIETPAMDKRQSGLSEYELAKRMSDLIVKQELDVSLAIFDRESYPELAYSSIVMKRKSGDILGYFVYLIEATGINGITTDQYIEMIETKRVPFVTTDAIDNALFNIIERELSVKEESSEFLNIEGIVIPADAEIDDRMVYSLVATGYNALVMEIGIRTGEMSDINIREEISRTNASFTMRELSISQPYTDSVGRQHKVSWGVDMTLESKQQNATSPNTLGSSILITSVKGRLNFLPEEYTETQPGMLPQVKVGFHPQVIIEVLQGKTPSLSFALMGLFTSAVMAKDNNWMRPILDGTSPDIGVFNKILNVFAEKSPAKIDIVKGKLNVEEKVEMLHKMAHMSPILSMDITMFDDNASVNNTFAAAANGVYEAGQDIIDTLSDITNGAFPSNFSPKNIFATTPIELPVGRWNDKNGEERTLDEIDTPYILSLTGNVQEVVSNYTHTELGQSRFSFYDRCSLIQRIGILAAIDARKLRVTFTASFVDALISSMITAGLSPRFDAASLVTRPTGFGFTTGMFSASNIGQIGAFQPMSNTAGQTYQDIQRYGMGGVYTR